MSSNRLFFIAALSLTVLAGLAWFACGHTTSAATDYGEGQTVVIRPQTPFVAKHTEVTVRLDIRKRERVEVKVDPETAIIFADPRDERLVEQVLWRVECWNEGELGPCPDLVKEVVITPKDGCPPELFGTDKFEIPLGAATAIASGEPNLEVYAEQMKRYQSRFQALLEKEQTSADSLLDCNGEPVGTAPKGVNLYRGFTWLYNVTVYLANERQVQLDPEVWIERDKDP